MSENQIDVEEGEEESKFVKLLNRSIAKVKDMKHVDGKYALEYIVFPLLSSFYREFDDEMENVLQKMEVEDAVVAAIEQSPEFIQEMIRYVAWVGTTFDRLLGMGGFTVQDPKDPKVVSYTAKATDEVKKIAEEVRQNNLLVLQRLKDLEESMEDDDDDGDDDGEGDEVDDGSGGQPVAAIGQGNPENPVPVPTAPVATPEPPAQEANVVKV
jgi:hypothetical protein